VQQVADAQEQLKAAAGIEVLIEDCIGCEMYL
jgi:hypothetical protein